MSAPKRRGIDQFLDRPTAQLDGIRRCGEVGHDWHTLGSGRSECANCKITKPTRCPICGGLNPGDITHTRCM